MKMNQEEHFDDHIRRKLQDAGEESPLTWEQVKIGLNDTGRSWMRGFLFSDLLMTLLFVGYFIVDNPDVNTLNHSTHLKVDHSIISEDHLLIVRQQSINGAEKKDVKVQAFSQIKTQTADTQEKYDSQHRLTENTSPDHQLNSNELLAHRHHDRAQLKPITSSFKKMTKKPESVLRMASDINNSTNTYRYYNSDRIVIPETIQRCEMKTVTLYEVVVDTFPNHRIISESVSDLFPLVFPGFLPFAMDVYGIVPVDLSQLKLNSNQADLKLNRGKVNRNYGYGLALHYPLNEHLFVSGGLQVTESSYELNYNFYYDHFFWQVDSITGFILSPFDPPVPLTLYDSMEVNEIIRADVPVNITESKMQIPISMGYIFVRNKWSFEGCAGFIYTFSQKQSISYSLMNAEEENYIKPLFPAFNTANRIDATVSLGVAKKLSELFEVFLQTYYQHTLGAATTSESVPEIRHRYTGIKAGVRINFSK